MEDIIDPNATKEVAMTSLDWCARSRQLTQLKAVLSAHFSNCAISDLERECSGVLRNAITSGCKDTVLSLLRHVDDAFLGQRHEEGRSDDVREGRTRLEKLLGLAVEHGHRDIAEVLLIKGANPNQCYRSKPLLHLSLSLGHHDVASLLVEREADVNMIDSKGETPIFAALASNSSQMNGVIDDLVSRGADVKHRSLTGRQPIHCAAMTSNITALTRLANAGCDVASKDGVLGDTPLHLACSRCCQEAVATLIRHGADFNAVNNRGDTPLRKLLQHATRACKDFHQDSRIKLARVLVAVGFRLAPQRQEVSSSSETEERKGTTSRLQHTDTPRVTLASSVETPWRGIGRKEPRFKCTFSRKTNI
ncbi:ankyrin repeat domain-containing protein 50-like isoform X2 [Littorina saxatilis]|uniref:ankyrin repeat domain-containing protein 50-like isoform X2 n=1 Tax=Littorina saxatilis TaxID=31220 RepID=UPI0038B4AA03